MPLMRLMPSVVSKSVILFPKMMGGLGAQGHHAQHPAQHDAHPTLLTLQPRPATASPGQHPRSSPQHAPLPEAQSQGWPCGRSWPSMRVRPRGACG